MRVLYVDLEREWRGGQSQALLTVCGLRERGHDVELLAARDSPLADRASEAGITVHRVSRVGLRAWAALEIRRLIRMKHFDLVHLNEPHALTSAWLAQAHKKLPLVVSRRVAYSLKGQLARARYLAAKRILAISRFVQKSILDSGLPPEMVDIVYEGVELPPPPAAEMRRDARQRCGVASEEILFGCVGYLLPEKGHELVVRSLRSVRAEFPRVRLLLAGDGPCRSRLEALAREQALGDAVIFAGFIKDISQVYAALDAFVFPSLAEPLGTSLLAAMAWGLPVVAVASGGVPEYVENDQTGSLVAQPEESLLSAAMLRLVSDLELAKRLGTEARAAIQRRLTSDHMVENTIRVYEEVLKERRPA